MPDEIAHIVDWTQYPLIAILLVVIYFAQKFYRDDRAKQDERLDRVLEGYQVALANNTSALGNNTAALGKVSEAVAELEYEIRREGPKNGPAAN